MDATHCVMGVDIGTSSAKALLFDLTGNVLAQHAEEYPLLTPVPGAAEQDPEQILRAVVASIAAVVAQAKGRRIACISFSAAMHSLIAIDASGKPLSPCITWADTRATAFADRIRASGGDVIYR